jgi:UDP-N-acetyl-D-mannosaminuronate dehydrogenase
VLGAAHRITGRDLADVEVAQVGVLHLCFPYSERFVDAAVDYVGQYQPELLVIDSTVVPGTTREVERRSGVPAVYSPVRGKHAVMHEALREYRKFVGAVDHSALTRAERHFSAADVCTTRMAPVELLELAKLLETSYFGVLIMWAQEMHRFAEQVGGDYWDLFAFFDEIDYLPGARFEPAFIGGHCIMPNLELLDQVRPSEIAETIRASNRRRALEVIEAAGSLTERLRPRMS